MLTLTDLHSVIFHKTGPTAASLWQPKVTVEPSVCMTAAVCYVVAIKRSTSVVLFIYLWVISVRRDPEPAEIRTEQKWERLPLEPNYSVTRVVESLQITLPSQVSECKQFCHRHVIRGFTLGYTC